MEQNVIIQDNQVVLDVTETVQTLELGLETRPSGTISNVAFSGDSRQGNLTSVELSDQNRIITFEYTYNNGVATSQILLGRRPSIVQTISSSSTSNELVSAAAIYEYIQGLDLLNGLVLNQFINSSSTASQIPSNKAVYDYFQSLSLPYPAFQIGTVSSGSRPQVSISGSANSPILNFVLERGNDGNDGRDGSRGFQGETGAPGPTPQITIGNIFTGSASNVVIRGTADNPILDFTLVRGPAGVDGSTPNISIGSVINGTSANASITGTTENPRLNLVLPRGSTGAKGDVGIITQVVTQQQYDLLGSNRVRGTWYIVPVVQS